MFVGVGWAKANASAPDRLIGNINSALCEQIFDIAIAQAESVVQPDSVADDVLGKTMAVIAWFPGFHPPSVANREVM
jgi:hypothetical protein